MHIPLCEYPTETAVILTRDIFWFLMSDTECIAKTVNDGNTDLAQYPAAKVQQMAKKLESSKATAKHIKQHTSKVKVLLLYSATRPDGFSSTLQPYPWQGTQPTLL